MPAKSILVTSFNKLNINEPATTASALYINPDRIIGFYTRTTAFQTTGIVDVLYALPINNAEAQITLIVTQSAAALNTAINANVIAT